MNTKELNFAYKIRHALNENTENLPASTLEKLASSRKLAVSRKKKDSMLRIFVSGTAIAGRASTLFGEPVTWLGRMGLAIPLVAVVLGLASLYEFEQRRRIQETAELDAAVLSDELPLSAYVDKGFNAYLAKPGD